MQVDDILRRFACWCADRAEIHKRRGRVHAAMVDDSHVAFIAARVARRANQARIAANESAMARWTIANCVDGLTDDSMRVGAEAVKQENEAQRTELLRLLKEDENARH